MNADINYKSNFVIFVLADWDVISFVYEVPFIFWHYLSYINVDEVSWITVKTLLQMRWNYYKLWQLSFNITKCDGQLLQIATAFLLQSATRFITNCDRYYKVQWIYYKLRKVLQSAMIITNCDSTDLLDCQCFPWTPPFWNVHYKHAQWILGRDPFNQNSNRSDLPFFRNFSGWTEPIYWALDRNFRKFWLNGSRP